MLLHIKAAGGQPDLVAHPSFRQTIRGHGNAGALNDVWVLTYADGSGGNPVWTQLSPSGTPPAARANHTAVYESGSNRMVVYGGDDASGATPGVFGDVWVLTNANGLGGASAWVALSPTGGPPPSRSEHTAIVDPATNRMTIFGGHSSPGTCTAPLDDLWVLTEADGTGGTPTWSAITASGAPPIARTRHQATYDAANNRMTLLGGLVPCGATNSEVWILADANGVGSPAWTQLAPTDPPANWSLESAVYDPVANRLTAFGGMVGAVRTDTVLTLSNANGLGGTPAWTDRTPVSGPPAARTLHSAVQANQRMIAFAGLADAGRLDDVWVLEEIQGRVVDVPKPPVAPPTFTGFSRPPSANPALGATRFSLSLARSQRVDLSVWDVAGRRVARLFQGEMGGR